MKKILLILTTVSAFLLSSCTDAEGNIDASGSFESFEIVVSAEASGKILSFAVSEGDHVEAGQVLGQIETTLLALKKEQLFSSGKGMESRIVDVPVQTAALRQQLETLESEKVRIENLLKSDAVNTKQLDDINAQLAMMEKQLQAQTVSLNNGNSALRNEIAALNSQIAQLDEQIENAVITSPLNGTVLVKYAEKGEYTTNGKALIKIANLDQMFLRAYITSGQLSLIKLGQAVKVLSDFGEKGFREYTGRVTWIADEAEFTPKTVQTRDERANLSYAVKVSVPNDGYIKIGMYGGIILNNEMPE